MSGVNRIFSRREKKNPYTNKHHQSSQPGSAPKANLFGSLFAIEDDHSTKPDKEEERKVVGVLERLRRHGVGTMSESNARYALRAVAGDGDAAYKLLMLLQETFEGIVKPYKPDVQLTGAVNREMVTCYLDALLFSMFALLDNFEAMLYDNFTDTPRRKLAGMLRLWVNMLRTGRLITPDVTQALQAALSECGWEDAARIRQQDPSEAFTFITGQLELPLLTLKMDLYHTGKEDVQDDHKFVNERLLEVAILEKPLEGTNIITLEQCLENYFNNRIEVKRYMEKRRNTLKTASTDIDPTDTKGDPSKMEKESGLHVEVAELSSTADTPLTMTPLSESPSTPFQTKDPLERLRPSLSRARADSIFSQRKVEVPDTSIPAPEENSQEVHSPPTFRERKLSTRTEVLMPAWQFFKLLPWYTDNMPESDAQVAAHFSRKRPVLGICLKRYSYTNSGEAQRRDTYVDIPLEIAVPEFVSDEQMQDDGPLMGNFRLLLMSVVCHRGVSVDSGHYVSLCRATPTGTKHNARRVSSDSDDADVQWMRFDDLAQERVSNILDIQEALRKETPYLLFYQVQPIDDFDTPHDLPSYAEATLDISHEGVLSEKLPLRQISRAASPLEPSEAAASTEAIDFARASSHTSGEISPGVESPRGRSSMQMDERRDSIATASVGQSASNGGSIPSSVATTPNEEREKNSSGGLLSVNAMLARRASKRSKSRPTSVGPDSSPRFNMGMSKLTQKLSRNDMSAVDEASVSNAGVEPRKNGSAESVGHQSDKLAPVTPMSLTSGSREPSYSSRPSTASPPVQSNVPRKDPPGVGSHHAHGKLHKQRPEDRECVIM